jgi:hypothetical protein
LPRVHWAKFVGVFAFAQLGGLRWRQAAALGATLLPMSGLALLLQHDVAQVYPQFAELGSIVLAGVIVMEFIGPMAVQWGLRFAGEAAPRRSPSRARPSRPPARRPRPRRPQPKEAWPCRSTSGSPRPSPSAWSWS